MLLLKPGWVVHVFWCQRSDHFGSLQPVVSLIEYLLKSEPHVTSSCHVLGLGTPHQITRARRGVRIVRILRGRLVYLPADKQQHAAIERIRGRAFSMCRRHAVHVYTGGNPTQGSHNAPQITVNKNGCRRDSLDQ